MRLRRLLAAAIVLAVIAADQASKFTALRTLQGGAVTIAPFLDRRLGFNRGVAFGLLAADSPAGRLAIISATAAIVAALSVWLWRTSSVGRIVALALIIGGASGNILDRARAGKVTDFIDLHVGALRWPTFNLADCAIVAGVAALLLFSRQSGRDTPRSGVG